ncbi:hypothetical protein NP493_256g01011 [Ridgeia piscesae]|uniref:CHAT domain-containing protein n=1 Tax=Ridgeia piscesae TaxID=27915 RepID=A0AAD9NYC0_RIDPI|nr:hypothetical protein NP493_256g01011 [Ridgeia piscesae]
MKTTITSITVIPVIQTALTSPLSLLSQNHTDIHQCHCDYNKQVEDLLKKAEELLNNKDYDEALSYYNEVLSVDGINVDGLAGRAAVYIETGEHSPAQQDAHDVLGHYLLAVSCHNLGEHHKSLDAFLHALDLDTDLVHVEMLTSNITSVAVELCGGSEKLTDTLAGMDPYKKMCEVGTCLYRSKIYDLCIKVLDAAQQLETNQIGITMKVQLTLANAHSALKHKDLAITLYQELLSTAVSAHDTYYQMKALVNVASLFLDMHDTHQAVVYYNKLLDLQHELQGGDPKAALPDYWTPELSCALHVNLSIAYKSIGDMKKAVTHAHEYTRLIRGPGKFTVHDEAGSRHNLGVLYEILGRHDDARCHVHAQLKNAELSNTYHRQQIAKLQKAGATMDLPGAYEQWGTSLSVLGRYDQAAEVFQDMFRSCATSDVRSRALALCMAGSARRKLEQRERAMYYYERAMVLAEDHGMTDLLVMCEYNQAVLMQRSTGYAQLDRAHKYLERLIPLFESKMQRIIDEDTFCPRELRLQLDECYSAMQNILALFGKKEDSLLYAELAKKRPLAAILDENVSAGTESGHMGLFNSWSMERIVRVVSQQNATVVCYTVLQSDLLIWLLQPDKGLVTFCTKGSANRQQSMGELLQSLVSQLRGRRDVRQMLGKCENRALPRPNSQLERKREWNAKLNSKEQRKEHVAELEAELANGTTLTTLPCESPIVFIPDKELFECPFGVIRDWTGTSLHEVFHISCMPSFYVLERVSNNDVDQTRHRSDVELRRQLSRLAGMSSLLNSDTSPVNLPTSKSVPTVNVNAKCVSNPLLARSLSCDIDTGSAAAVDDCSWQNDTAGGDSNDDMADRQVHIEKAMGSHTLTTLVTHTSTNTDVVSSSVTVADFKQVSLPDKCTVIGNPSLPERLLVHVAHYTGVFVSATMGCLVEGLLVMSPNLDSIDGSANSLEHASIVTAKEIAAVSMVAKLVVLSSCWSATQTQDVDVGFILPSAFLAAGAQCVLVLLWSVPDEALEIFYKTFYKSLENGNQVAGAVSEGMKALGRSKRFDNIGYTAPFLLVGKDVHVNLTEIHHAMVDQMIDEQEGIVTQASSKNPLNLAPLVPAGN